jgi:hypothetical protein
MRTHHNEVVPLDFSSSSYSENQSLSIVEDDDEDDMIDVENED